MDEARHCDRIGFVRRGKLIAEGKPAEILQISKTESLEDAFLEFSKAEDSKYNNLNISKGEVGP
jgi:ABC-2 type transport system ATP-binding protein